jgi:outer membrane protein TolC
MKDEIFIAPGKKLRRPAVARSTFYKVEINLAWVRMVKATGIAVVICCLSTLALPAQQANYWDWTSFRSEVLRQHPLARQADLFVEQARAGLLRAKGGFDPKVYGAFDSKNFNDKNYFQYTEAGVKWPTWLGLEFKGNFNQASGVFLNPESKIPTAGQVAAGFNWTLGQGLLLDDRRADLQQSRIGLQQSAAERSAALNDLLLDAAKAYWNWVAAENAVRIYEEALRQAQIRYEGILESFAQGDKPAIDTLEAFIQVQNRTLDVNFARVDVQNAELELANFRWTADGLPAGQGTPGEPESLVSGVYQPLESTAADNLLQTALRRHPSLLLYDAKLRALNVERRLKTEKRKPVLDLGYQLLGDGWQFFSTPGVEGPGVLANDIKWSVRFSYPLLNRKARGDWQMTQVKIAQTDLGLQQKRLEIENKVRQYTNERNVLAGQVALYRDITANYRALLDGENEKFRFGESSVFLINTREQRWLEAQIKYLKLLAAFRKTEAGLQWAAGDL